MAVGNRRPRAVAALAGIVGLATLAGCGSSNRVAVDAPRPTGQIASACANLIARLPDDLAVGERRRPTRPTSPYTAAFGDPPVIVRCGVAIPRYDPTADVLTVGGVEWLLLPGGSNSRQRFLAYHSDLRVEVTVDAPELPANVLPPVSTLVAAATKTP